MDGGVFATNPAMCALAEALNTVAPADVVLVSLGTGERTHKRDFDEIKDWGLANWARPILDVVFDGVSDAVNYQLEARARPPSATGASRWSSRSRATTSTTRPRATSPSSAATRRS